MLWVVSVVQNFASGSITRSAATPTKDRLAAVQLPDSIDDHPLADGELRIGCHRDFYVSSARKSACSVCISFIQSLLNIEIVTKSAREHQMPDLDRKSFNLLVYEVKEPCYLEVEQVPQLGDVKLHGTVRNPMQLIGIHWVEIRDMDGKSGRFVSRSTRISDVTEKFLETYPRSHL